MEWVSVKKRLPKRGETVLVASREYRCRRLSVTASTFHGDTDPHAIFWPDDGEPLSNPVAWMPLPAPPTEDK
ncbi:MAG: DUF551 domain-containing protein [Caulobacteraceae bacterium]|nr:DUF551 domain-containing protein [Caulobacteraceae bacterium]